MIYETDPKIKQPKKTEAPDIEARAVKDERGFALLFDLWVDGKWVGSRRTIKQCEHWLSAVCSTKSRRDQRKCVVIE